MFDPFQLWFGAILRIFRTRRSLMLENLALRQQLAVLKHKHPRPRLGPLDKFFWVVARGFWSRWEDKLLLVLPETVVQWHQAGFKLYRAMLCKVRKRVGGGRRISDRCLPWSPLYSGFMAPTGNRHLGSLRELLTGLCWCLQAEGFDSGGRRRERI
jgi:hypothetical protein